MKEDPLSQEEFNAILARALEAGDRPENQPVFSVQRTIFPNSRMVDHVVDSSGTAGVAVYNMASERRLELGTLVSARLVDPFDVRLVRVHDADSQEVAWRKMPALRSAAGRTVADTGARWRRSSTPRRPGAGRVHLCLPCLSGTPAAPWSTRRRRRSVPVSHSTSLPLNRLIAKRSSVKAALDLLEARR